WTNTCMKKELIQPDLRGRSLSKSLLNDELVSLQVASYLRSKKFNVDSIMVKNYFEQEIFPLLNIESVQGLYANGHEHPDVVEYHQTFLLKEHVWVTHDETIFYVYDRLHSVWGPEGEQLLRKKGLGAAVYISDFLTETIGSLKDDQKEARVMMILDANCDGYWDSEKLFEQVKRAVNIFERTYLGCVGVFAFDNATSYKAFSENSLVASKMNLGLGGLAPKMCETM
ncbi:8865_t:CDS:2, partial [Scutellospora calospora]